MIQVAHRLKLSRHAAAGLLMEVWEWADDNIHIDETASGFDPDNCPGTVRLGDSPKQLFDATFDVSGLADALTAVGWIEVRSGSLVFPNFARHNGKSAKARALDSSRKRTVRNAVPVVVPIVSGSEPDKTRTREEKSNQDKTPSESCTASPMPDASGPGASSPPKKTKKPRAVPDSTHHQAIAAFCDSWRSRYGASYPFNGGKDAESIKAILNHHERDLEAFVATVSRYLADDDPFVVKACHGVGLFRSQLAKWLTDSPREPLNGVTTKDQQTADRLGAVIQEARERMENERREAEYADYRDSQPPELEAYDGP